MTTTQAYKKDRREGTHEMVRKLLEERQEMLLMFCRVAGLEPFKDATPNADVLQEFCQVLVDYSAFGHFEIYERIVSGRERRTQVAPFSAFTACPPTVFQCVTARSCIHLTYSTLLTCPLRSMASGDSSTGAAGSSAEGAAAVVASGAGAVGSTCGSAGGCS